MLTEIETTRLRMAIGELDGRFDPAEVLQIFNSNPDFIEDLEGSTGKRAYTSTEVKSWPVFQGPARKNQRFLEIRMKENGKLVGFGDLLTPHPKEFLAALGLLIIHSDCQRQGVGREAVLAIETTLASEGWPQIEVVVQIVRPRSRHFWESCRYRYVRDAVNERGQPCWVLRKAL
ncbi:MAG: GNAT family N-acetyltransferase [Candidatus Binataceae bacterium]